MIVKVTVVVLPCLDLVFQLVEGEAKPYTDDETAKMKIIDTAAR